MLRLMLPLLACALLAGCALTRVSDATLAAEVDQLHAVGLTMDAARKVATEQGFECSPYINRDVSVSTPQGTRKTDMLECSKKSLELVCPQRRYVVFNLEPSTGLVRSVGKRFNQNSCF
ncbi:hypothetical protein [Janthinobacterium sp.]|uniref:hypothetical protein n=1 Tax=Janthinobacterium sp. TaxID=1871054 RepID=UPI00262ABEE8|nr:hypothetical protein [Janthinobacterium sp.]